MSDSIAFSKDFFAKPHRDPQRLTHGDVRNLSWAVGECANWRGAIVGNPDPEPLREFDRRLKATRAALRKVRELKRQGL